MLMICSMGLKSRCVKFCEDLNQFVPINNLGGSRRYAGCPLCRGWEDAEMLTISPQGLTERAVA